jgi:hypothetical protein
MNWICITVNPKVISLEGTDWSVRHHQESDTWDVCERRYAIYGPYKTLRGAMRRAEKAAR